MPERNPPLVGANSRPTTHVLLIDIGPGMHGSETTIKSPVFPAVGAILLITSGAVPQLVMVRLCTAPVEFTATLPKFIELLLKQTDAACGSP